MSAAPLAIHEALSPAWLTAVLGDLSLGDRVVDASITEVLRTIATKVRFHATIERNDGSIFHRYYCVKGHFDWDDHRKGISEARFYRDLAPSLSVRRPDCVYVGIDDDTGHSLHIMPDLVASQCRFLTASAPYSAQTAAESLTQLAILHVETWANPALAGQEWLRSPVASIAERFPTDSVQALMNDGRCIGLPPGLRDAGRLVGAMRLLGSLSTESAICLVHGDAHAGNVYTDQHGLPGLIDWPVVHYGHWALDVAYHISAVLDVEDRRENDTELLRGYLATLERLGGVRLDWEDAWWAFRAFLAYGYYLWGRTRFVERPVVETFVTRLGQAVLDHDSLELLGV